MTFSSDNRFQKRGPRRIVLGVLALSWLNVAAQPCLMAMGLDSSNLPEHSVYTVHSEHHSAAVHSPDCSHCPPVSEQQQAPCETASASDCELSSGLSVDGRQFEQKAKDISPTFALSAPPASIGSSDAGGFLPAYEVSWLKFAGDPPRNLLFCVFLK